MAFQLAPALHPLEEATRRRPSRWPWIVLLLVVAAVAGGYAWREQHRNSNPALELATARTGDIEDAVTALGKIQPRDYVDVGAQVSGQLKTLTVKVGDTVKAGALLAEIDPQLQVAKLELDRAQLAQLEADRAVQQLQVELSSAQFERQVKMKGDGATRDDVFEQKRSDMRIARAKLDSIDAQIRAARSTIKADEAQLGYTRIFAPLNGTVVSIDARPGQTVIASQQVPVLLRIADLSSMTVWAQVSEADITRLRTGMDVYFTTLGHADRKWNAKLSQLLPAPPKAPGTATTPGVTTPGASSVVLYTALFDVDNSAGELRPEMSAQVYFVVARAKDAVIIPASALSASDKTNTVTVAAPHDKLESRTVKVGVRNRFDVQIVEGVSTGDKVVQKRPTTTAKGPLP